MLRLPRVRRHLHVPARLPLQDGTPTNNNYRDTYSYAVRPTLMHQFGSAVETDLWFSQSGVFFVTPSSTNTDSPSRLLSAAHQFQYQLGRCTHRGAG